jgi:hypothetical protein
MKGNCDNKSLSVAALRGINQSIEEVKEQFCSLHTVTEPYLSVTSSPGLISYIIEADAFIVGRS